MKVQEIETKRGTRYILIDNNFEPVGLVNNYLKYLDTSYILGFDEDLEITKHNFRQVDALPFAKEGTLEEELDRIFGE